MSGNWDSEYEDMRIAYRLDEIQADYDALQADAREQKRQQMQPSDLERFNAAYETAKANQRNWDHARHMTATWRTVAILATTLAVGEALVIIFFR